ncbi:MULTISPECIES: hypothetical protein [unclassified Streptomyces]|uniref:hypothetical protein n=1 Tax=unclassified Streptomyces TaxID=2593676 RepID=UPI0036444231
MKQKEPGFSVLEYVAGTVPGPSTAPPQLPVKPLASRTPPPISSQLKPRLATGLFRRYLRACIPTGFDLASPLAGARPEAVLAEAQLWPGSATTEPFTDPEEHVPPRPLPGAAG